MSESFRLTIIHDVAKLAENPPADVDAMARELEKIDKQLCFALGIHYETAENPWA